MKSIKLLLAVALIGVLFTYSGCKSDNGPGQSPQDAQLVKLGGTDPNTGIVWKCSGATLDGTAVTGYGSFTLTIKATAGQSQFGYVTGNRPAGTKSSPWAGSGTFTFGTDFATVVTRDDSLPVNYTVTDTQLQLSFAYAGLGYDARTSQVKGNWVFTFSK